MKIFHPVCINCIRGDFLKMKRFKKVSIVFIILFCILSGAFIIIFDRSFAYQLEIYSKREVVNTINQEINFAIINAIEESDISYDKIISLDKSASGGVSCVRADMLIVNKLKNEIDIRIADICECNESYEAKIPVGNLLGGGLLYGKGFVITVKFKPIGEANSRMTGELKNSGINQTIYRISFDVNVDAAVVFPFRYIEIPVKIETVISETVIIGEVPESYTYFRTEGNVSNEELQGYVQDFKAE